MKPNDVYLGVIQLFGVLVPGAFLLFLHGEPIAAALRRPSFGVASWSWATFVVCAYIAGHLLLGIGVPLNHLLDRCYPAAQDAYYQDVQRHLRLPDGVAANRQDIFYRAYSFVRLTNVQATAEIDRNAADYKLFRSLAIVSAVDLFIQPFSFDFPRMLLSASLLALTLVRFIFLLKWTYRLTFEYCSLLNVMKEAAETRAA